MIEFIDASPPSRELLRRLARADEPLPVRKLVASVSASERSWTALSLIAVAGLVSVGRKGVLLTGPGREVLARMSGPALWKPAVRPMSLLRAQGRNGSQATPPVPLVSSGSNELVPVAERVSSIRSVKLDELRAQPAALFTTGLYRKPDSGRKSPAILTAADHRELSGAIVAAKKLAVHPRETQLLQEKLSHALISSAGEVPPDVITLYSRAELFDLDTEERLNLMTVFPIDASLEQGRVSVFDSLGAAMLGRRVGDRFDWNVPYGVRRFEVQGVNFQPEAALAKAA
jgi:regulator of nucleoside diphosphate kinase